LKTSAFWVAATATLCLAGAADAAWKPTKTVEFIVTSGPGGGTDTFARTVQSIVAKHKLMDQSIIVSNKGGGSGAEGYAYGKAAVGDPHKVTFGTNNEYLLPLVAKLAFQPEDLTPVAAMALDEFLIWVNSASPYKDAKSYIAAAKEKPETLRMGGSQSKDTDQTLVSLIEDATGAKFIYVPYKGGGEAAVQLAGGHIDSNTNNPNENLGQWKAGNVRPLCVFSPTRLPEGPKVTESMGWSDIPTCKESGIPVEAFQMPRTVWLATKVPAEAVQFYVELLKKVHETPEWKEYVQRTAQTDRFMTGEEFKRFVAADHDKNQKVFAREGWLVK
jgi:tripartite-type tricarboxylate transporter receptor subunit TctC